MHHHTYLNRPPKGSQIRSHFIRNVNGFGALWRDEGSCGIHRAVEETLWPRNPLARRFPPGPWQISLGARLPAASSRCRCRARGQVGPAFDSATVQADLTTFAGGFLHMDVCKDPAELTPNERLRQIAAILAAGLLRLRRCLRSGAFSAGEADSIPNYQESRPEGLELSRKTRLSVPVG